MQCHSQCAQVAQVYDEWLRVMRLQLTSSPPS
jgi:hypothetical protein